MQIAFLCSLIEQSSAHVFSVSLGCPWTMPRLQKSIWRVCGRHGVWQRKEQRKEIALMERTQLQHDKNPIQVHLTDTEGGVMFMVEPIVAGNSIAPACLSSKLCANVSQIETDSGFHIPLRALTKLFV